jgi:prephenate dehydratase
MEKIAIRGVKGSFHDQVGKSIFGENYSADHCNTFGEIVSKVENEQCEFGILAIENSLAGTILENYNILRDSYVEITGEFYLQISHHLLALPGTGLQHIEKVMSHEMALKQCRKFLDKTNIKERLNFADTASATATVQEHKLKNVASIGSLEAAELYGLEVISSNVQDNPKNYTRFLVIRRPKTIGLNIDKDKATIVFSVNNEAGKLALALNFLNSKGINLTKIESVPQIQNPGKFDMITDLELPKNSNFKDVLPELYQVVEEIKVLGIYKKENEPWN